MNITANDMPILTKHAAAIGAAFVPQKPTNDRYMFAYIPVPITGKVMFGITAINGDSHLTIRHFVGSKESVVMVTVDQFLKLTKQTIATLVAEKLEVSETYEKLQQQVKDLMKNHREGVASSLKG